MREFVGFLAMCGGVLTKKIVYSSVPVVSIAVLMSWYQFFCAVVEVSNMENMGVRKYWLYL